MFNDNERNVLVVSARPVMYKYFDRFQVQASYEVCKKSKTPMMGFSETAGAVFQYGPEKFRWFAGPAR